MEKEQINKIMNEMEKVDIATEMIAGALQDIAISRQNIFSILVTEYGADALEDAREKMVEQEVDALLAEEK